MSRQTAASFFILPLSSEANSVALYQALFRGIDSYWHLGNRLVRLAEQAHAIRQFDKVKELALLLSNIPIKDYRAIGYYFLAVATHRKANGDWNAAGKLFERAIDIAPDAYKVKAHSSLGALSIRRQDFASAFGHYQQAIRSGKLSADGIHAVKALSVVKALEGSHRLAINDLESILPVIKYTPPYVYFDILNSYAVELGEVGRRDEARNVMRVVLASPFIHAYPEWQQTAADLQGPSRSVVQVADFDASPENVLSLPPAPERVVQSPPSRPGKLLNYMRYKKKIAKKKKDEPEENIDLMDKKDLLVKLLELTAQDHTDEEELRQVVKCAVEIMEKE